MTDLTTKIQWTDFTINFWTGCFKVDEECKFCYMYRDMEKYGQNPKQIREVSDRTINAKLRAARALVEYRKSIGDQTPVKIFLSSWTDVFLAEADHLRPRLWKVIAENPDIIFQILTKRPDLIPDRLPEDWGDGYPNVWLGTSVGQPRGYLRIIKLLKVNAKVLFLSCEPLLAQLDLTHIDAELLGDKDFCQVDSLTGRHTDMARPWYDVNKISWVIVGGESGNEIGKYQYRECRTQWIMDIINQCKAAGVPVFVKQLGTLLSKRLRLKDRHAGDISEWPQRLRVREMPRRVEASKEILREMCDSRRQEPD